MSNSLHAGLARRTCLRSAQSGILGRRHLEYGMQLEYLRNAEFKLKLFADLGLTRRHPLLLRHLPQLTMM